MTRQQLLCAVISRNNDNAFLLQSCLGMSATENRSDRAVVISGKRLSPESTAIN